LEKVNCTSTSKSFDLNIALKAEKVRNNGVAYDSYRPYQLARAFRHVIDPQQLLNHEIDSYIDEDGLKWCREVKTEVLETDFTDFESVLDEGRMCRELTWLEQLQSRR